MKYLIALFLLSFINSISFSLTAEEILSKIDENSFNRNEKFNGVINVIKKKKVKSYRFTCMRQGYSENLLVTIEYGNNRKYKILKKGNSLYEYSTWNNKIKRINKKRLESFIKESDFTLKDIFIKEKLSEIYTPEFLYEVKFYENDCYKLKLISKSKKERYYTQHIIVDKEKFVILHTECFNRDEKLIKEIFYSSIKEFNSHFHSMKFAAKDIKRPKNTMTEISIIEFDNTTEISHDNFSLRNFLKEFKY